MSPPPRPLIICQILVALDLGDSLDLGDITITVIVLRQIMLLSYT